MDNHTQLFFLYSGLETVCFLCTKAKGEPMVSSDDGTLVPLNASSLGQLMLPECSISPR